MAVFEEVAVADDGGEEGVQHHGQGDIDVDGAFDEAQDQRPATRFFAGAVVGGEGGLAFGEGGPRCASVAVGEGGHL